MCKESALHGLLRIFICTSPFHHGSLVLPLALDRELSGDRSWLIARQASRIIGTRRYWVEKVPLCLSGTSAGCAAGFVVGTVVTLAVLPWMLRFVVRHWGFLPRVELGEADFAKKSSADGSAGTEQALSLAVRLVGEDGLAAKSESLHMTQ
jgi:hypothetical protein